jgi:hypothetical protein
MLVPGPRTHLLSRIAGLAAIAFIFQKIAAEPKCPAFIFYGEELTGFAILAATLSIVLVSSYAPGHRAERDA